MPAKVLCFVTSTAGLACWGFFLMKVFKVIINILCWFQEEAC